MNDGVREFRVVSEGEGVALKRREIRSIIGIVFMQC